MSDKALEKTFKKISTQFNIDLEKITEIWEKYSTKFPAEVKADKNEEKEDTISETASASSKDSSKPKDFDSEKGCQFILTRKRPGEVCGAKVKANNCCARHCNVSEKAKTSPAKTKNVPSQPKPANNKMTFRKHPVLTNYLVNLGTGYLLKNGDPTQKVVGKVLNNKFEPLTEYDYEFLKKKSLSFDESYEYEETA